MKLTEGEGRELIRLARRSIDAALELRALAPFPSSAFPAGLQQHRSAFVTLRIGKELRGCCGSIEATCPLAREVWRVAWASAFNDPRFPPLTAAEWPRVHVHISVLAPAQPLAVQTEADLIRQLRPGVDGVIVELGAARATFLPSVWEQLPDPTLFVRHLKLKAGWSADFWSPRIAVWTYECEGVSED